MPIDAKGPRHRRTHYGQVVSRAFSTRPRSRRVARAPGYVTARNRLSRTGHRLTRRLSGGVRCACDIARKPKRPSGATWGYSRLALRVLRAGARVFLGSSRGNLEGTTSHSIGIFKFIVTSTCGSQAIRAGSHALLGLCVACVCGCGVRPLVDQDGRLVGEGSPPRFL